MKHQRSTQMLAKQLCRGIWGLIAVVLSATTYAADVAVRVSNIDSSRPGVITMLLFSEEGFPKDHDKALLVQSKPASSSSLEFTFTVDSDEFAIKILHDEDESGTVKKNWTGIVPAEGLGFSNGAKLGITGPPRFRRARLRLSEIDAVININLIYP